MKAEPQGKNAMKKSLAFILSICLVLSLCACGARNSGTSSPVVSVTMQDLSQSCYADDGSTLLFKYSDKLPSVTVSGNEAATTAINNTLKKVSSDYSAGSGEDGIDALLAAAKAQYADDPSMFSDSGMSYSMERTADVARGDKTVLSIVYTAYSFTGGVHGLTSSFGENLNTATGTELKLADIASDRDAFAKFCADYIVELTKGSDYSGITFNDDYKSTVSSAVVADGSWYFSGDGVVFIADQYTLAAYAAGAFRFTVPYSKLTGLLKDEYMGVSLDENYTSVYSQYYNLPNGAYVKFVESGSAAEKAGIAAGDIITKVGDKAIASYNDLTSAVKEYHAGDSATITLYRSGKTLTVNITFGEAKATTSTSGSTSQSGGSSNSGSGFGSGSSQLPQQGSSGSGSYYNFG